MTAFGMKVPGWSALGSSTVAAFWECLPPPLPEGLLLVPAVGTVLADRCLEDF